MHTPPLRFLRRGEVVTLHGVPPSRTLLEVLREDLHCTGTKEGCAEGDCGACAVVISEPQAPSSPSGSRLQYRTVNSCIRLAHSIHGKALWTVEDLAAPNGTLHPAQTAMVQCHGSQCGFCTPGFIVAAKALLDHNPNPSESEIRYWLAGNLCRCTGYDKIVRAVLDAAAEMRQERIPA